MKIDKKVRDVTKKKVLGICISLSLIGFACFLVISDFNLSASTLKAYSIEEGIAAGDVIQQENEMINLFRFEDFYKNIRRGIEDSVTIAIVNHTNDINLYELIYTNNQLKVYYDISQDEQGRKEYKIKIYHSLKKILKGNQVIYKLVNENEEREFLSYNLQ